ncbi:low specificity L-threonine aldolase [Nocardia sp. NPDC047038]|uniref:threonine aldolase family protein n=1 Tax=Nocardia sp. NPDC047038 TaxID=3154338 RepID=UPI003407EA2C
MSVAVHHTAVSGRTFASDNHAGVHPEVLAALALANEGDQGAYGNDDYTHQLQRTFARHFGFQARSYPVFNGTGANVVALQALLPRWGAVIAAESAHLNLDEGGAPEQVGIKIYPVTTPDGKLTPELIDRQAWGWGIEHRAQPLAVSISQSTELGTCYTSDEIRRICDRAHELGMLVHGDGARLANAAATLGVSLRDMTTDAGMDVLSFGGTKNGLLLGEAIVVLNPQIPGDVAYLRKSSMQLASKMRFISAQFEALLGGDLWLRNAAHANAMAIRLATAVREIGGLEIVRPVQANAVFATVPRSARRRLQQRYPSHVWNRRTGEVRWMCSFDTTTTDVDNFVAALTVEIRAR